MKIVLALFDDAASSQTQPARLLQQSASVLQKTVQPEVSNSMNRIDKHIRLVLDCSGPRYVNAECIGSDLCVRRVRNLYYTHSFADMILREAVLNHAQVPWFVFIVYSVSELLYEIITILILRIDAKPKVRSMVTRCHMQAIDQGSRITTMFPTNSRQWHPIMEDVAFSDAFELKLSEMTTCLERNDEWHYISMDATMKICLKVMGQESYRASKDRREAAPFPDEIAFRRVLTVRGRSGAVLLLHPLQGEASEHVVAGLATEASSACGIRQSVGETIRGTACYLP